MSDLQHLLDTLKEYRRNFVEQFGIHLDLEIRRDLAEIQMTILAVEAVMAEHPAPRTGPRIEFGPDGYPK